MVEWHFLFLAMERMEPLNEFNHMVSLFLKDAKACIKINGFLSKSFTIKSRIRQKCSLAPYFFLIEAEVLHSIITKEANLGLIKVI